MSYIDWEIGEGLVYTTFVILIVASVYAIVVPLIDPSGPFSGIITYAKSRGTLALGLLVGSILVAASLVMDKFNSFGR